MNNTENSSRGSGKNNNVRLNFMSLEYVSIDKLKIKNEIFFNLIEKYNLKTYADLGNLIKSGNVDVIKNGNLLYEYYKGTKYIGITLRDVSVAGLHQDKELFPYLQIYSIDDYEELEEALVEGRMTFTSPNIQKRLEAILKYVKKALKPDEEVCTNKCTDGSISNKKARIRQ